MHTALPPELLATSLGQEANNILRSCVHCGFCIATCPTYQVLGNELDSPRGRIYLIKEMLEGGEATAVTQLHLDRCLTCQSCETTCPSGVNYHRLLDIGRAEVEQRLKRPLLQRVLRRAMRLVMPHRNRFTPLLRLGQYFKPVLPQLVTRHIPAYKPASAWPTSLCTRKVILFEGCVQPGISPNTNAATARVLEKLGIACIRAPDEACCGALSYHASAQKEGLDFARQNIDAWWPYVEQGVEAIVSTASGCGNFLRGYQRLLRDDPSYAAKARKIDELVKDISEVLAAEDLSQLELKESTSVAFHCPCTLQHGLSLKSTTQQVLLTLGFVLPTIKDDHLCCGSAGTYSIFNADISNDLLRRKLEALEESNPDIIITANIGCQTHLAAGAGKPVKHWIEQVDELLR
ncbi:MAG: glycolate oxidase subunit GlcF [Pseudomonadales bacterium]